MSETGIVIVTWNAEDVIGACLDAALRYSDRVVVVDNASADATVDAVRARPQVRLIANRDNRGFAAAVNQGVRSLDCPYVLLLNPDAVIETPLDALADACREPDVAAAGGRLLDENGLAQKGFLVRRFPTGWTLAFEVLGLNRLFPSSPVNRRYRALDFDPDVAAEVDQPAGAFLMLRRDVWQGLGGFCEDFHPLWFEDVDYARRARDRGFRMLYVPAVSARHRGAYSIRLLDWERRQIYWYANLLRYAAKHLSGTATRGVGVALALSVVPRTIAGMLAERNLRPVLVCGKLLQLAVQRILRGAGDRKDAEPVPAL
jgi:hypothetical protein